MGFQIADDDDSTVRGKKAIYFPESEASHDCRTLGYECVVVGQVRSKSFFARQKRFLIYVEYLRETAIANENELILCGEETPPIAAQGEVVIAWEAHEFEQEIVGAYRASQWVPRSSFLFRHAAIATPRHDLRKSESGRNFLIFDVPSNIQLNADYVIGALGKITGQVHWRLLPYLR